MKNTAVHLCMYTYVHHTCLFNLKFVIRYVHVYCDICTVRADRHQSSTDVADEQQPSTKKQKLESTGT